jgi:hypothetical protein
MSKPKTEGEKAVDYFFEKALRGVHSYLWCTSWSPG